MADNSSLKRQVSVMPKNNQGSCVNLLVEPQTGLAVQQGDGVLTSESGDVVARNRDGVWSFLDSTDEFYEGAYLNRIRHLPRRDTLLHRFPFFFVTNGFVWEVCKHFPTGARLLELGCASGVDYLAQRYKMIGLDYSLRSLQGLNGYDLRIQADAAELPFAERSLDGAISSYFWEHIEPVGKDLILGALYRCIRPGGKIVFLYDIQTDNRLIAAARKADPDLYQSSFLDRDGHIGYETVQHNTEHFEANGFRVLRQIGMERAWLQSHAAYAKLAEFPGRIGRVGRIGKLFSGGRIGMLSNMLAVRGWDTTIGRLWPLSHSRILMTVAERMS